MAISDRIQSIEEHIKESYQELEGIGIDTTGVNKNLENIPKLIDGYWETLPKVTGEGTSITLDNTKEGKMKINLKGNTSQEGTPTPETPQDIQVVSGDNSIKVEGKNLFDSSTLVDADMTGVEIHLRITSRQQLYLKEGTYTFSTNLDTSIYSYSLATVISNPMPTNNYNPIYTTNYITDTTKVITISSTKEGYFMLTIRRINNTQLSLSDISSYNYQLEKSSTATTYEPYQGASYPINLGTIELCKIGDYQDRIYKENGKWYIKKQIGKKVFVGTENWTYKEQFPRFFTSLSPTPLNDSNLFCSHYIKGQTANVDYACSAASGTGYSQFLVHDERFSTKEAYNTWLSNNNVTLYYILATPTYTEITDSTLISQLEALNGARSYNPQTNVSQENNDLPFILDVTALKQLTQ